MVVILVKSTLASLPLLKVPLVGIPSTMVKRLEKLPRDFLWGGGALKRKAHLVNWEVVCTAKGHVGLGLRRLPVGNKTFLGKWI